ncbi:TetR/AcrR family transcriptional regulator [Streptoalloteichus tenebrarius]|uniref:TetR/AcrR family transcriptional regulator n=1 Tax=Streptoalloteichus tenebrarius (strain ATCC 17920 / DSM 40477 / JCM 4838 / CBS 697.72 / NBRC 16177 / NCIMB 11028 / NRRL B-12390 / A12253. 1 / ISP 5477) TaxID=1933 RepID=UPI0020A53950|nr:TetR/AcrR family transcriptional regulator [Streptoalloteichus tenebrarius]BFF02063.1 TetR/AcrR family transcriptional regulator [Streptoalloteichus tenebrarius]
MARPRKISDEQLLAAAARVVNRVGPGFTLAQVAEEAGVVAATLVQRFGSKRGLLTAQTRATTEVVLRGLRAAAAEADGPVEALRTAALAWFAWIEDPEVAVNNLGQLGMDLVDPDLRAVLGDFYRGVEREFVDMARAAVGAGELPGAPPPEIAGRVILTLTNGTAVMWSIRPEGSLRERMATDLDAVIWGWRRPPSVHDGDVTQGDASPGAAREEES